MNILYANTMNIQYIEEWFKKEGGYVNPHDLKAVKERIEHAEEGIGWGRARKTITY